MAGPAFSIKIDLIIKPFSKALNCSNFSKFSKVLLGSLTNFFKAASCTIIKAR